MQEGLGSLQAFPSYGCFKSNTFSTMQKNFYLSLICATTLCFTACNSGEEETPDTTTPTTNEDGVVSATLNDASFETFGQALADQIIAGDGAGIDNVFRNSGVVVDPTENAYYAVNGVHPVNNGDYTSYFPKSVVKASLADDSIMEAYSFGQLNGHNTDMEALSFVSSMPGMLYVGDEYNYVYELDLTTGDVTREWDLADINVNTGTDRGIEAMTYSESTGYFYLGIQDSGSIIVADLSLDGGETITEISEFTVPSPPSGLYAHSDGSLYMVTVGGGADGLMIYRYSTEGELLCELAIPGSLGMTRPDGIFIDEDNDMVYIVDSQGPLFGGHSLYRLPGTAPCDN